MGSGEYSATFHIVPEHLIHEWELVTTKRSAPANHGSRHTLGIVRSFCIHKALSFLRDTRQVASGSTGTCLAQPTQATYQTRILIGAQISTTPFPCYVRMFRGRINLDFRRSISILAILAQ